MKAQWAEGDGAVALRPVRFQCGISCYRRTVNEIFRLLGFYAAYDGSFLPTFRDNIYVSSWRVMQSKKKFYFASLLLLNSRTAHKLFCFRCYFSLHVFYVFIHLFTRSRWPYIIKCRSETTCLLGLRVQISLKAGYSSCVCVCVCVCVCLC